MSRHTSEQNGLSTLISKKPYDCVYEKKGIRVDPSEHVLVPKRVTEKWNHLCNEVLEVVPTSESWTLISIMLSEMGQRKESSEVAASKDSNI